MQRIRQRPRLQRPFSARYGSVRVVLSVLRTALVTPVRAGFVAGALVRDNARRLLGHGLAACRGQR